jgi:deoxyribonucleoside regulator
MTMEAQGVVGDVATIFLREGTCDIPLNERSGVPPHGVPRAIPGRLCVGAGTNRARGLRGELARGLITDLAIDERTAEGLVGRGERGTT